MPFFERPGYTDFYVQQSCGKLCARLPLTRTRLASEEQRLAGNGRHDRELERLGDQERRLRSLAGEEALGIGGDEDHRHFERSEQLIHRVETRTAVGQLDVGEDQPRPFLAGAGPRLALWWG